MTDELLATAHHEAGHAVITVYLGNEVDFVELTPDHPDDFGQAVYHDQLKEMPDEMDESGLFYLATRTCCISFAGQLAEQRFRGTEETHGGEWQDNQDVLKAASLVCEGGIEETEAFLAWLWVRTRDLVTRLWPQIEAVAKALHERKRLDGSEVLATMSAARM